MGGVCMGWRESTLTHQANRICDTMQTYPHTFSLFLLLKTQYFNKNSCTFSNDKSKSIWKYKSGYVVFSNWPLVAQNDIRPPLETKPPLNLMINIYILNAFTEGYPSCIGVPEVRWVGKSAGPLPDKVVSHSRQNVKFKEIKHITLVIIIIFAKVENRHYNWAAGGQRKKWKSPAGNSFSGPARDSYVRQGKSTFTYCVKRWKTDLHLSLVT